MNSLRIIFSFLLLFCCGLSTTTAQMTPDQQFTEPFMDQMSGSPELTVLLDDAMNQEEEQQLERAVIAYRMAGYYEKQGVPELGIEELTNTETILSQLPASQRSLEISQMIAEYYKRNGETLKAKRMFLLVKEQEYRLSPQSDRQKTIAGILFFMALIGMIYWGGKAYMRRKQ